MTHQATFIIAGKLSSDPERIYFSVQDESKYIVVSKIEVTREEKKQTYEVCFSSSARDAAETLKKGQYVRVEGRMDWKPYISKHSGKEVISKTLYANVIFILPTISGKTIEGSEEEKAYEETNMSKEDIPF